MLLRQHMAVDVVHPLPVLVRCAYIVARHVRVGADETDKVGLGTGSV